MRFQAPICGPPQPESCFEACTLTRSLWISGRAACARPAGVRSEARLHEPCQRPPVRLPARAWERGADGDVERENERGTVQPTDWAACMLAAKPFSSIRHARSLTSNYNYTPLYHTQPLHRELSRRLCPIQGQQPSTFGLGVSRLVQGMKFLCQLTNSGRASRVGPIALPQRITPCARKRPRWHHPAPGHHCLLPAVRGAPDRTAQPRSSAAACGTQSRCRRQRGRRKTGRG